MHDLSNFMPMDRRQALARDAPLPDCAHGAALLTDIVGFTALAEALATAFGPQRGAEELTQALNQIYAALIATIDHYGGSVIGFSGDALTCWFDDDDGARAITCARALQQVMAAREPRERGAARRAPLPLKIGVARGPVRRLLVGDPQVQIHDILAGRTVERLARAVREAQGGEVVVDPQTAASLVGRLDVTAHRPGAAVVAAITPAAAPAPWPPLAVAALRAEQIRPWVLPAVRERLQAGQGVFLAELRPAVALFLRFAGLDYDGDAGAGTRLDTYVRWVQQVLRAHEGFLIDLTLDDQGSYLYAAFGAPLAHADDAARAAAAALELRTPPADCAGMTRVQIGLSQGVIWAGACGSATRQTYAVLGDPVNLGARLMEQAAPGEILAAATLAAAAPTFAWTARPALPVRGKAMPIPVYALTGGPAGGDPGLLEPAASGPFVGRRAELAWLDAQLDAAQGGTGRCAGVAGEAGLGKSRLVGEFMQQARAAGWQVYAGAAQAFGTQTPYLAGQALWRRFFAVDPAAPPTTQAAQAAIALAAIAPALRERLPLLGPILGLPLPDTALTTTMDEAARKVSLEALLVDCLRARASEAPILLLFEDCHWLDPVSWDVLTTIARAIGQAQVLLLVYRPADGNAPAPLPEAIAGLPHFAELRLAPLDPVAAARLVAARLNESAATPDPATLPAGLVAELTARADGNPFYLEELLSYLADQGIVPGSALWAAAAWERLDWPPSLHRLLLARIDRLSEQQRTVLKVASIVGRRFRFAELQGVYPELGPPGEVQAALGVLDRLGLTPHDALASEPSYLFKHMLTQEATYESLPFALRARLHEQFAAWLEAGAGRGDTPTEGGLWALLAYHYGRSTNQAKQREYYGKAGDAAAASYAPATAQSYYERLLPLLAATEQAPVLLALGQMLVLQSDWPAATARFAAAIGQAQATGDAWLAGRAQIELGFARRLQGNFVEAQRQLEQACATLTAVGDDEGLSEALTYLGNVYEVQSAYAEARAKLEASRDLCRANAGQPWAEAHLADLLQNLGKLEFNQGHYAEARAALEECVALQRRRGDKVGVAAALNVLGYLASAEGDPAGQAYWEEELALSREIGDRWGIANSLNALGYLARSRNDPATAQPLYAESLALNREIGSLWGIALALNNLGYVSAALGDSAAAWRLLAESAAQFHTLGDKRLSADGLSGLAAVAAADGQAEIAARFLAATTRLLDDSGAVFDPLERAAYERNLAATRAALPADTFAIAWTSGMGWSWEEMVGAAQIPWPPAGPADPPCRTGHS